jgi:hypothetical protein
MSNAERQRRFQARHPGYDRRRKARRRGAAKRDAARRVAALEAQAATTTPAVTAAPVEMLLHPLPTYRLALPAPVEDPFLAELK